MAIPAIYAVRYGCGRTNRRGTFTRCRVAGRAAGRIFRTRTVQLSARRRRRRTAVAFRRSRGRIITAVAGLAGIRSAHRIRSRRAGRAGVALAVRTGNARIGRPLSRLATGHVSLRRAARIHAAQSVGRRFFAGRALFALAAEFTGPEIVLVSGAGRSARYRFTRRTGQTVACRTGGAVSEHRRTPLTIRIGRHDRARSAGNRRAGSRRRTRRAGITPDERCGRIRFVNGRRRQVGTGRAAGASAHAAVAGGASLTGRFPGFVLIVSGGARRAARLRSARRRYRSRRASRAGRLRRSALIVPAVAGRFHTVLAGISRFARFAARPVNIIAIMRFYIILKNNPYFLT